MKRNLFYLSFLILLVECDEEISNVDLDNQSVVVAAYLHANQAIDSIRITKSIAYSGTNELEVIDSLDIVINDGTEDIHLTGIGNGYYQKPDYIVKPETYYRLEFDYEGVHISSETYVQATVEVSLSKETVELERIEFSGGFPTNPPGLEPEIVDITWENPANDYFFVVVENIEAEPDYVNEIFEEFEDEEDRPQQFFRSEPQIMDSYSINSQRELQFFGTYEIIVYRLNTEYAALYETVGNSTLSIQEPPSNITNGLGIFTGVTPHYLYLEVVEK